MGRKTFTTKELNKLVLDINNPRFAELYNGSDKEEDLIEYLLYNESADEIAENIIKSDEFYPDRPLWVIRRNGKFLVKDGNRRCAAVKALQNPRKYGLSFPKYKIEKLPVLIYYNEKDLEKRKIQEHTANLFKEWDRIAKALEVYRLFSTGSSIDAMQEIDSKPVDLIKLASFYYEAVKIGGEDLKKLLRRGRGKTGGKTIVFERLFKYKDKCGYDFGRKPNYGIIIKNRTQFVSYIRALIEYLKDNPDTSHKDIDDKRESFLQELEIYGFVSSSKMKKRAKKIISNKLDGNRSKIPKKVVKNRPVYYRKGIPKTLEKLIQEYYNLDHINFANAKTAMTRVVFECVLKYVINETSYKGKRLAQYSFFRKAFYDKHGNKLSYTNFKELKKTFQELPLDIKIRKAFENFDLEKPHQIIHNYTVCALPSDADGLASNLMHLIEFLLQDESDLLGSIDVKKLNKS